MLWLPSWLRRSLERVPGIGRNRPPRTPTVLQMEAVECGAACLGILLAHHGRWVPLEELRLACGVSRDGSKANNMVKAARGYGFTAKGFKTEPAGLRKLQHPSILHWNFNHFVVLEGFGRGKAYINDPASGPRTVSEEELDQSFTGVVLVLAPGESFARGGSSPSLLAALGRRLVGAGSAPLFVFLASLLLAFPVLVAPSFTRVFVDSVLVEGATSWFAPLSAFMAATALALALGTWLQQSALLRLETRLSLAGSSHFLRHVLALPLEFFSQRFAGDISARVQINDRVAQLLSRDLAINAVGALLCLLFGALLLAYDRVMTMTTLAVVVANVLALRLVSRRRTDDNRRLLQERAKLGGTALGGLATIETIKAGSGESDLFARWAGYQARVVNLRQRLERASQLLDTVPPLLVALNQAAILGVGSLRVIQGRLTLGGLVAFQALVASFLAPVGRFVSLGGQLQLVEGDMNRLDDVLRYRVRAPGPEGEEALDARLAGHLEIRGLRFGYSRLDPPLIEGFDLVLRPGARVALVGGSGSGKSTVARLVAGLLEPWGGDILFDGRPRAEIPRAVLTASLAVVDQEVLLFAGTVRENLSLWDSTVPLPQVVAAARDAAIHEDIAARPGAYEAVLEENGANWSGGQRQRLELARALVGKPTLLVLDEATSALDASTEEEIDAALRRRGCTCLIVAHRLSTIRDADEIVVLEKGKIVERGGHEELLERGGAYRRLLETAEGAGP